MVKDVKGITLI